MNVIDAARLVESVKFILLGSVPAADQQQALFQKEFYFLEEHLKQSGISFAVLRMAVFVENLLAAQDALRQGQLPLPLGIRGAYCPVAQNDIGEMASSILVNPAPHHGSFYTITGPTTLSGNQMAQEISTALGKQVRYVDAPSKAVYDLFERQVGMPHWQVGGLLELYDNFQQKPQLVSNDFQLVTGHTQTPLSHRIMQLRHAGLLRV